MVWDGGLNARYRDAVGRSHTALIRVDVCDYLGKVILADVPIIDGTVTGTLQNRVSRTIALTLDGSYMPAVINGVADPSAPFAPYGNLIKAYRGILYGDGSSMVFPAFVGRIDSVSRRRGGDCQVVGSDLAAAVIGATFETAESSVAANSISEEFVRLVREGLPTAVFGTSDVTASVIGQLTWEWDRGKALDDMSTAAGMLWYPRADGSFVQRFIPWTRAGRTPAVTLTDNSGPLYGDPLVTDYTITVSRVGVNNGVVFTSQRQDGTNPTFAIVHDLDPTSPTYYLGPFGRQPMLIQNQAALSQSQCLYAAQTALKQARALTLTAQPVSIIPDASLELGDLFMLAADGISTQQVIVGFSLPLREVGTMGLTVRAYTPLVA